MGTWFAVNKCGNSIPVYNDPGVDEIIGSLYNRETFVHHQTEGGGANIEFLSPNGYSTGFIRQEDLDPYDEGNNLNLVLTPITDYPTDVITMPDDVTYYVFKMRQTMNIYDANGDYWGQVSAGCRVACVDDWGGENNPWYKEIEYVQESSGQWFRVSTNNGPSWGFVDSCLRNASGYGAIPLYGSW